MLGVAVLVLGRCFLVVVLSSLVLGVWPLVLCPWLLVLDDHLFLMTLGLWLFAFVLRLGRFSFVLGPWPLWVVVSQFASGCRLVVVDCWFASFGCRMLIVDLRIGSRLVVYVIHVSTLCVCIACMQCQHKGKWSTVAIVQINDWINDWMIACWLWLVVC